MLIKDRVKNERLRLGLTQPELAKILNVSKQTVSNWEKGHRIPDAMTLNQLADIFDCTIDYLIGRSNNAKSNVFTTKLNDNNYTIELDKNFKKDLTKEELDNFIKYLIDIDFNVEKALEKANKNK